MGCAPIPHLIVCLFCFLYPSVLCVSTPFILHCSGSGWALPSSRKLDNFPKIQGQVQEVLLAIHEAEGDETDAAPEQVDCARTIQNLSQEILGRLAVGPAENLEDEDNETLEPYELFRSSWTFVAQHQ